MAVKNYKFYLILIGCLSGIAGIYLAKFGISFSSNLIFLSLLIMVLGLRNPFMMLIPIVSIPLIIGNSRGLQVQNSLNFYNMYQNNNIVITGIVKDDPIFNERKQSEFNVENIVFHGQKIPGKVKVTTYDRNIKRTNKVKVTGTLRPGFANTQGYIYFAKLEQLSSLKSISQNFRDKFISSVQSLIAEPAASLGLGFLIGVRSILPETLENQLSVTGLTHIVAVSGYNLTILVNFVKNSLSKLSKFSIFILSLGFLIAFLMVSGLSPSVLRASIVSILSLSAWYFGREFKPLIILFLSALISAWINPLHLWFDIGWYLSFAAFYGVLVLAPILILKLRSKRFLNFKSLVIETTCAQLMTIPIIILIFKEFSLISLLANLMILPTIPIAMLSTFIAGIAGITNISLLNWLAIPAEYILGYIINTIEILSYQSWALVEVSINKVQFLVFIVLILFVSLILAMNSKTRNPEDI